MRTLFVIFTCLLLVPSWSGAERLPLYDGLPVIRAEPVALYPDDPARRDNGALTYLGGVSLTASDPAFGGFSSLHVRGDRFELLSDGGSLVRFRMGRDWQVRDVRVDELAGPGTGWEKEDRDTESMVVLPDGSRAIGYERHNEIWWFDRRMRPIRHVAPRAMSGWPTNAGPEAMTRRPDGAFFVLSEAHVVRKQPGYSVLLYPGDPTREGAVIPFRYVAPPRFRMTDATMLPDGRMLVLTRNVSLSEYFTARLQIADVRKVREGQVVVGRTIARFASPTLHDNFEGISLDRAGGRWILWMVSDDNQSVTQRTLVLKFALPL